MDQRPSKRKLRRLNRRFGYHDARLRGLSRREARKHAKAFALREVP